MERPADWQCPNPDCVNHHKMVFGTKATCPKCGSAPDALGVVAFAGEKPQKGMQGGDMADDWPCPNQSCINHTKLVFGKKSSCPSCGTARNAKNPGDWQCPNNACINHKNTVFANKTSCPKCGMPRPGSYAAAPQPARHAFAAPMAPMAAAMAPMMSGAGLSGLTAAIRNNPAAQAALAALAAALPLHGGFGGGLRGMQAAMTPSQVRANPGDWQCPNPDCLNHRKMVFSKHETCPKCGTAKAAGRGAAGFNLGDWQCPNASCRNHRNKVFARHQTCPQCGEVKPADARGRSRSPYRAMGA